MDKEITVKLTQEEANAAFMALISRLDYFDEKIKEEGKYGRVSNVIAMAERIDWMKRAEKKLLDAGATLWC